MKEIEIDEAYSIKHDGVCWHLIHRQVKKREKSDKDGRWSKETPTSLRTKFTNQL